MRQDTFPFEFDRLARIVLAPAGIFPSTAYVHIDEARLAIRFGPWHLITPLRNIIGVRVSGPYSWLKAVGPHLSLVDGGATFGTNAKAGVCVRFRSPVAAIAPVDWLRHPGVTVTVAEPQALAARLADLDVGVDPSLVGNAGDMTTATWKPHEKHGDLDTADRDKLPESVYAFPSKRKEPLTDASHVRNAVARFDQVEDVTDAERELAFANIKKAARHYDVEVTAEDWHDLAKP